MRSKTPCFSDNPAHCSPKSPDFGAYFYNIQITRDSTKIFEEKLVKASLQFEQEITRIPIEKAANILLTTR
ncbi:MAG: hypothetical protein LBE92_16050 [Chryseobacterium sp.]|nr:hypothetical protein [Chryseobacterium sp.]